MPEVTSTALFFGVNVSTLLTDLKTAWRGLFQSRALRWLVPRVDVRLVFPSGARGLATGLSQAHLPDGPRAHAANFVALVLPEDMLLRRTLKLPALSDTELRSAIALDVNAMSPFPAGDSTYTFHVDGVTAGTCQVHIALTSKQRVDSYVKVANLPRAVQSPEVWVARMGQGGFVVLSDYANALKAKTEVRLYWAGGVMVFLALALVSAIAMSATLQLYLRADDARTRWAQLQQKVAPLAAARESLLKNSEQLNKLDKLVGPQVPLLETLKTITDALPDDTALTSLKIRANKITMAGQTPDTAALMKHLSAIPSLSDVKAPIPATKPPGVTKELFTVEATVAVAKPAAKP